MSLPPLFQKIHPVKGNRWAPLRQSSVTHLCFAGCSGQCTLLTLAVRTTHRMALVSLQPFLLPFPTLYLIPWKTRLFSFRLPIPADYFCLETPNTLTASFLPTHLHLSKTLWSPLKCLPHDNSRTFSDPFFNKQKQVSSVLLCSCTTCCGFLSWGRLFFTYQLIYTFVFDGKFFESEDWVLNFFVNSKACWTWFCLFLVSV